MIRHVAPHRWADAAAGKLRDAERAAMDRHASQCVKCAKTRARISRISAIYPALRAQSSPEVSWDAVRARVHWSVSTERRTRAPRRWLLTFAAAGTAAGIIALGLATGAVSLPFQSKQPERPEAPLAAVRVMHPPAIAPVPAAVTEVAGVVGVVTRLAGEVTIDGVRRDDAFDRQLGAGTVLATADGAIDVQFGDASAFALGPHSQLELRRFDAETIELSVEGTVDIELAPRAHGQRFLVVAGDHTVEVRGTQFQVTHDRGGTKVACRHGLVAVRSKGAGEVEVGAAHKIDLRTGRGIDGARAVELSTEELAQLVQATPVTTPLWTDADAIARSSAPLEIAAGPKRVVRLDGVEIGEAPLRVRVMPGRHTVEAADRTGRFRRAGWVDVGAAQRARFEVEPIEEVIATGATALRKQQLHTGIDQARLKHCTRAIVKAGLTDTYVQIEISVDASGAVSFLNVIETDLPSSTASCVREALADVVFGAGAAATWREKLEL